MFILVFNLSPSFSSSAFLVDPLLLYSSDGGAKYCDERVCLYAYIA